MEGTNWNTEERFITHPAQFPVRLFLIGLQVSDLVMQSVIFFLYTLEFLFLFFWLAFYLAFRWRKVLYAVIMYEGESCITTHLPEYIGVRYISASCQTVHSHPLL